ncbi:glycosyltransferase family 9 protein [Spirobacillus cienkowskii]|uniref:glycosyltransferase family 9 protein n=1 Tax=Spirobacillus cienkowskii TaxID=495820 RepID=UPI0030CE4FD5
MQNNISQEKMHLYERVVYITRLTSIGDALIASHSVVKLIKNNYFPVFITSSSNIAIAQKIIGLKSYIIFDSKDKIDFYIENKQVDKEYFLNFITSIPKNKKEIFIDLQKTTRSKKCFKHLIKKNKIFIEKKFFIKKMTLYRFFLIFLSFFYFKQKNKSSTTKYKKIREIQDLLINKIIQKDNKSFVTDFNNKEIILETKNIIPELFSSNNYICIFPGSSGFIKSWPKEKFRLLISEIINKTNLSVIICGAEKETFIGDYLCFPKNNRVINMVNKTTLEQSLNIIANCRYLVSNDSFAGHAADIFNIPASIIFGSTSPKFGFVPLNSNISIEYNYLSCSPCTRHGHSQCRFKNLNCMQNIDQKNIFLKIKEFDSIN